MAQLKRSYNVPLRKEWLKVPRHQRAHRAMRALRKFLARHMKVEGEQVRIGPYLNEYIWANGMRNPPHHAAVNTEKNAEGLVLAELEGKPMFELKTKEEKKEKSAIEEKLEGVIGKKSAPKSNAKKEAKKKAAEKKSDAAAPAAPKKESAKAERPAPKKEDKPAEPSPEKPAPADKPAPQN